MSKKILVADDSPTIQKVVELTFMEEDFEVVTVSGGDEAMTRFEEVEPQIVIADVHMPGASGIEVCRRVKERSAEVPVLLLVGAFEPFDEGEFESSGADGVLKKPFDSQELFRRVEELLTGQPPAPAEDADDAEEETAPSLEEEEAMAGVISDEPPESLSMSAVAEREELEVAADGALDPDSATAAESAVAAAAVAAGESAVGDERLESQVDAEAGEVLGPLEEEIELPGADLAEAGPASASSAGLSDGDVDRIARRVVEMMSDGALREVAWEVLPDIAEVVVRERLRELESEVE